jgi:hypothetical protein
MVVSVLAQPEEKKKKNKKDGKRKVDTGNILNKRHPMPDFKLIKPHGHERDKVIMLQAAYNQEHIARVSR